MNPKRSSKDNSSEMARMITFVRSVARHRGLAPNSAYEIVADAAEGNEMLREANAQLVVSEQSIRNECNRLREEANKLRRLLTPLQDCPQCHGSGWIVMSDEGGIPVPCDCWSATKKLLQAELKSAAVALNIAKARMLAFNKGCYPLPYPESNTPIRKDFDAVESALKQPILKSFL